MGTLDDLEEAYCHSRQLAQQLSRQNREVGDLVRQARTQGLTWKTIAAAARVSEPAVIKAARRPVPDVDDEGEVRG